MTQCAIVLFTSLLCAGAAIGQSNNLNTPDGTQGFAPSIPHTMSYQGLLTTASGATVGDGSYDLHFDLYDSLSGGSSVWTETQNGVNVRSGTFSVILGSLVPLYIEFTRALFVNVVATNGPAGPAYPLTFSPRAPLSSAPYSLAPWLTNGPNVYYDFGGVGIGTSFPFFPLHVKKFDNTGTGVQARVSNTSTSANSLAAFSLEGNNGSVVTQSAVDGLGTGPLGVASGYYGTYTNHPVGLVTGNVERMRVTTAGNVGIGVTSPAEKLDVAGNIRLTGNVTYNLPRTAYISGTGWALGRSLSSTGSFTFSGGLYNDGASTAYYEVPLQLPDGVKMTQLNIYVYDGDAVNQVAAYLYRQAHGLGFASALLGTLSSGGSFNGGALILQMTTSEVIDNSANSYYFELSMPASATVKYMDFRATYTYTSPGGISTPAAGSSAVEQASPMTLSGDGSGGSGPVRQK
jgi:hypothetical protein